MLGGKPEEGKNNTGQTFIDAENKKNGPINMEAGNVDICNLLYKRGEKHCCSGPEILERWYLNDTMVQLGGRVDTHEAAEAQ